MSNKEIALSIYEGALQTARIYQEWEKIGKEKNLGALCVFTGIVRDENGIEGLSFDIYEPLLKIWFRSWQEKANNIGVHLLMAHSMGDVENGASSFMTALLSSQRKAVLSLYGEFIEDFKQNAPIWKYDIKNGKRKYAQDRAVPLKGSGLLG